MFGSERVIKAFVNLATKQTPVHTALVDFQVGRVVRRIGEAQEELEITEFFADQDSPEVSEARERLEKLKSLRKVLSYITPTNTEI